ncbi:hypothetical protein [Bacillus sp. OTU2372]|uniref:hypothetical protein n=1 Tax=Bacillus sp. OTU2372 TaxID=3043858 RepID=UPI00313BF6D0
MIKEKIYTRPIILSHQPLQFETRHSWNPGKGNSPDSDGNSGINFKDDNKNPQPCGAGTASNNNGNGNGGNSGGIGQCNPNVN